MGSLINQYIKRGTFDNALSLYQTMSKSKLHDCYINVLIQLVVKTCPAVSIHFALKWIHNDGGFKKGAILHVTLRPS